jgi:asparagine synthase (glutamine-hydrolysing)
MFDVLRSDRSMASHGLEARTPFLDKQFVAACRSIPTKFLRPTKQQPEKYILRFALDGDNILPSDVLWRKKEAFSDGVSSQGRSLYKILQEKIVNKLNNETGLNDEPNILLEKDYYKALFSLYYPNCESIVPYYWMPKYIESTDPSARTLSIYSS